MNTSLIVTCQHSHPPVQDVKASVEILDPLCRSLCNLHHLFKCKGRIKHSLCQLHPIPTRKEGSMSSLGYFHPHLGRERGFKDSLDFLDPLLERNARIGVSPDFLCQLFTRKEGFGDFGREERRQVSNRLWPFHRTYFDGGAILVSRSRFTGKKTSRMCKRYLPSCNEVQKRRRLVIGGLL